MANESDPKKNKRFQGIFIQFDELLDLEYASALQKAFLLFHGVGKGALVLEAEEISVSPRLDKQKNN